MSVDVRDAPAIEGLTFRHFRGEEDYSALLDVGNRSKLHDGLEENLHTLDTLRYAFENRRNHDRYKDVLIAEVGGKMVAYNLVFWEQELEGSRAYWHFGWMLPEWRGKGIGRAMIRWVEGRARELEAEREDEAGERGPAYLSTDAEAAMQGMHSLLKEEGYEPVHYDFNMEADLSEIRDVPLPEGLEIRPAKPEQYRAVWDAMVEAFRDHWGSGERGDEDFERWRTGPMLQPDLWVVAWDGDQVAGSILNYINHEYNARSGRKLGYTEWISVRRPWRGRGLAKAMLSRSMKMHKERGMTHTALGVDAENPMGALKVYQAMGYKVVSELTIYRKQI